VNDTDQAQELSKHARGVSTRLRASTVWSLRCGAKRDTTSPLLAVSYVSK